MKPFLNILVGVNYTESSRHALIEAKRIASENGAKITACHVIPLGDLTEFVDFYMIEHKSMLDAAKSSLEAFVDDILGKDHGIACQVSEGTPHHEIASIANEDGYDLLVLGDEASDENSATPAQFVIRCLRFTTMPVLLVNRPTHLSGPVAACLDFSDSTSSILENIARLNLLRVSEVDLIHSSRPPWLRPLRLHVRTMINDDHGRREPFREILLGRLEAACNQVSSNLSTRVSPVLLEDRDPITALITHLKKMEYSFVVIGRTGQGIKGLLSDFLGGTAECVLRLVKTNVLIIPIQK